MTRASDPDVELLTSPLQRPLIGRVFIIGGPLGLAIAIALSLYAAMFHVRHSVMLQAETTWIPGEPLAVRALVLAEQQGLRVGPVEGSTWLQRGNERADLVELAAAGEGTAQGTFSVPGWSPGPAELHVRLSGPQMEPRHEVVPVTLSERRSKRTGTPMVSGSTLQYGDDSDPQPEDLRIDVRTAGRLLSEFENTLFVRVLESDGTPWRGPLKVLLVDGEFMDLRGQAEEPPVLVETSTDRLGLVSLTGALHSEVLRVEVHVLPPRPDAEEGASTEPADSPEVDPPPGDESEPHKADTAASPRAKRRVRLVSFAGGVRVQATPSVAEPTAALQVHARGLSARRPVFVDLYGSDGAWVYTLHPPFEGGAPPRDVVGPTLAPGIVQLEGYQFTTDPGQSTDVVRIQLATRAPTDAASLDPLLAAHRDAADAPRVDQTYSADVERKWLSWVDAAKLSPTEVEHARAFLLGTLPLVVHDPPLALATRDRDLEAMAAKQRRWTLGLRIFMLGGGGLFLLAMTLAMMRAHARAAAATAAELQRSSEDGEDLDEVLLAVDRAKRAALARAFGVIAIMAAGLVLATLMLESLLWVF